MSSSLGGMDGTSGKPARGLVVGAGGSGAGGSAVGWVGTRGGGRMLAEGGRSRVGEESAWKVGNPRA